MQSKMQVTARLEQRLVMTQQLRQAISLLQYNTLDLQQFVQQIVEMNPLLEDEGASESESELESNSGSEDLEESESFSENYNAALSKRSIASDETQFENYSVEKTLRDHLMEQTLLCHFDEMEQKIAESIIDAIDENGHLTMPLDDIQNTMDSDPKPDIDTIKSVLKKIQVMDPVGIGSSGAHECLLIQLESLQNKDAIWQIAYSMIEKFFMSGEVSNEKKIIKQLRITSQEYQKALCLIRALNPHPGLLYSSEFNFNIEPELSVKKIRDTWKVFLNDSLLTRLKINNHYQEIIKKNTHHASYASLKDSLEEARWLLSGLKRRNDTLLSVASEIMRLQHDFLEKGSIFMKSINIAVIAKALDIHESTVSRVTTGKYISTPQGVFELKYFFSSSISTDNGQNCSAIAIKCHIKNIIEEEKDSAYSDEDIADILRQKGINIARRTVAKYREAMKILPSYQRSK